MGLVCNNLSDIPHIVEMIRNDCSPVQVLETKDMVDSPSSAGYRATHVRTKLDPSFDAQDEAIPCEIQIRTLCQDTWGRLSRVDLYGKEVPASFQKPAHAISTQLSAIDEMAQLIRDQLNRTPPVADEIEETDHITPQRLALLYKHQFGHEIYEWTLVEWVQVLQEAEAKTIADVIELLNDKKIRWAIDKISNGIRGFPTQDGEWAVYSGLVASKMSTGRGIKEVKARIQDEWDEIVSTARRDILAEMPDTLEEFAEMLRQGSVSLELLIEIGATQDCFRCGNHILSPEHAAEVVLNYYGNPNSTLDLELLFFESESENTFELEGSEGGGLCQWCDYETAKEL